MLRNLSLELLQIAQVPHACDLGLQPFILNDQIVKVPLWVNRLVFKDVAVRQDSCHLVNQSPSHLNQLSSLQDVLSVLNARRVVRQTCRLKQLHSDVLVAVAGLVTEALVVESNWQFRVGYLHPRGFTDWVVVLSLVTLLDECRRRHFILGADSSFLNVRAFSEQRVELLAVSTLAKVRTLHLRQSLT